MSNLTEALDLIAWFDECDGFRQGTDAPHKWVLQADSELRRLSEQVEKLTEAYDQCGRTVQDYGRTIDQTESRLREVATHCANVEQQLAALAEQNEKMREDLSRWRYQNLSYNWCCGNCGVVEGDEHKEGCALSLPNLATPALNRIKADGMWEAAKFCINNPLSDAHSLAEMLRAKAAELEKDR